MVNIFYYKKNALNFYKKKRIELSYSVEQRKESDSFHIIKHIKIGKSPP